MKGQPRAGTVRDMIKYAICTTTKEYAPEYIGKNKVVGEFITTREEEALVFTSKEVAEAFIENLEDDYDFLEVIEVDVDTNEYFVISSRNGEEEVRYFGSDLEAAKESGRIEWNHLTPAEQKKCSVVIGCGEVEVDEYGDKYYNGYDVVHEF